MKITKSQLRRIIKEAYDSVLKHDRADFVDYLGSSYRESGLVGVADVFDEYFHSSAAAEVESARAELKRELQLSDSDIDSVISDLGIEEGYSFEDIFNYLETNAEEYLKDKTLTPGAIRMLMMDDWVDDLGHQVTLEPQYQRLIDTFSGMKK